ncbi:MAG: hypothetical protein K6G64_03895 [Eubacterium sp.]|nr:hypothetical protein [Eubacterium sp.]
MGLQASKLTRFDSELTSPTMQMLKAVIPFIDPKFANPLGILIKFQELQNAARFNPSNITSTMASGGKSQSENMLSALKDFLGEEDQEQLEMILSMMELLQTMNPEDFNMDFMDFAMNNMN